jgi:hypothetical protein
VTTDDVITVVVLENDGAEYGVNGWAANQRDRLYYADQSEDEADEHQD